MFDHGRRAVKKEGEENTHLAVKVHSSEKLEIGRLRVIQSGFFEKTKNVRYSKPLR